MKTEKLARVRYDESKDSFVLELWDNVSGEWDFSMSVRCVESMNAPGSTEYIHFSFMKEIVKCVELGYAVHFAKEG